MDFGYEGKLMDPVPVRQTIRKAWVFVMTPGFSRHLLAELGFTPLNRLLAGAFYRIIASCYERASLIVTSNKTFESWAEMSPIRSSPARSSIDWSTTPPWPDRRRVLSDEGS